MSLKKRIKLQKTLVFPELYSQYFFLFYRYLLCSAYSDLHLMHNQEFIYKPRGYDSAVEMSEDLVNKWNEVIHEDDTVYVLGDLIFGDLDIGKV